MEVLIISKDTLRINEEIHVREVRLTGADGEQLGIVQTRDALKMAEDAHLDLVEVAPHARPPVCKIMNYGKFRYEQQKRDKETRKKQKTIVMKEVKLRPGIEEHDLEVKVKAITKFIAEGSKVKVTIMFRGREVSHPEIAQSILNSIVEKIDCVVERPPKIEGKNMMMIVTGKKVKTNAKDQDTPRSSQTIQ